jgi:hypothetical protein
MDSSFISDLENGKKEICIRNLELLATTFGMTVGRLMSGATSVGISTPFGYVSLSTARNPSATPHEDSPQIDLETASLFRWFRFSFYAHPAVINDSSATA